MKDIFPAADSFEPAAGFTPDTSTSVKVEQLFLAKKGGTVTGAVVQATGSTYDKATILIGLDLSRTISTIKFTALSDTPGIGQKATEPAFMGQFDGKSADDAFEAGSDVQAISGATITSKGVAQILKYATYAAGNFLAANYGGTAGTGEAPVIAKAGSTFTFEEAYASLYEDTSDVTFEEFPGPDGYPRTMLIAKLVRVSSGGRVIGAMATAQGQSYHGAGIVLTAIDLDGNILGARIIQLPDTPNIGLRALEEEFWGQFSNGLRADEPILAGEHYDTLSGASISADCVADMAKVAAVEAAKFLAEHGGAAYTAGDDYPLNENYHED
jgi:electron transport complex protein RnfG